MKKKILVVLLVVFVVGFVVSCDDAAASSGGGSSGGGSSGGGASGSGSLSPPSWIQHTWEGTMEIAPGQSAVITYTFTADNVINTYKFLPSIDNTTDFTAGEADKGDILTEPVKNSNTYEVKVVETGGDVTTITFVEIPANTLTLTMVSVPAVGPTENFALTLTKK